MNYSYNYGLYILENRLNWIKTTNPKIYHFYKDGIFEMETTDIKYINEHKNEGYEIREVDNKDLIICLNNDIEKLKRVIEESKNKEEGGDITKYKGNVNKYIISKNIEECPVCKNFKGEIEEKYNGRVPVFCRCDLYKLKESCPKTCAISLNGKDIWWKPISNFKDENGQWIHVAHFGGPALK